MQRIEQSFENNIEDYYRIGARYYRLIQFPDSRGRLIDKFEKWERQALMDDFGKDAIKVVSKFKTFCNVPSHIQYQRIINNCVNLYSPLSYIPKNGKWPTIEKLLRHVFSEQYEVGLDYLKIKYMKPTQLLPLLALVSEERSTGKTTFGEFLQMLFCQNAVFIGENELKTEFNASYAYKLFAIVEEIEGDEKDADKMTKKIKAISTANSIMLRMMHRDHQQIPFFCSFVFLSNKPDAFVKVDLEEARFWIRKLPSVDFFDKDFKRKLEEEIPYFADFLIKREYKYEQKGRFWFDMSLFESPELIKLKINSIDSEYREIIESLLDKMHQDKIISIEFTAKDISKYLLNDRVKSLKVKRCMNDILKVQTVDKPGRYVNELKFDAFDKTGNGHYYTLHINDIHRVLNMPEIFSFDEDDDKLPY